LETAGTSTSSIAWERPAEAGLVEHRYFDRHHHRRPADQAIQRKELDEIDWDALNAPVR
jgi:hypothetical protein